MRRIILLLLTLCLAFPAWADSQKVEPLPPNGLALTPPMGWQDAKRYAAWGVDYLKYDWCYTGTQNGPASYRTMADALRETGRPIVFSACEWGTNRPWRWAAAQGANLWRATADIADMWQDRKAYQLGVLDIIDRVEPLAS